MFNNLTATNLYIGIYLTGSQFIVICENGKTTVRGKQKFRRVQMTATEMYASMERKEREINKYISLRLHSEI